jgi:hypothetical protein
MSSARTYFNTPKGRELSQFLRFLVRAPLALCGLYLCYDHSQSVLLLCGKHLTGFDVAFIVTMAAATIEEGLERVHQLWHLLSLGAHLIINGNPYTIRIVAGAMSIAAHTALLHTLTLVN